MPTAEHALANQVAELLFYSTKGYGDPFNDVQLDAVVSGPNCQWHVPAFWAGGSEWRVRFAAPEPGTYRYQTECSDPRNKDLDGCEGILQVSAYEGSNPLLAHGGLQPTADRRRLEWLPSPDRARAVLQAERQCGQVFPIAGHPKRA